jgi:hypothetical protein
MKFIIAEFEADEQIDDETGEDAECETEDIDDGVELVPAESTEGKKQLFLYHGGLNCGVGCEKNA